jgi:hypothetical protein
MVEQCRPIDDHARWLSQFFPCDHILSPDTATCWFYVL